MTGVCMENAIYPTGNGQFSLPPYHLYPSYAHAIQPPTRPLSPWHRNDAYCCFPGPTQTDFCAKGKLKYFTERSNLSDAVNKRCQFKPTNQTFNRTPCGLTGYPDVPTSSLKHNKYMLPSYIPAGMISFWRYFIIRNDHLVHIPMPPVLYI